MKYDNPYDEIKYNTIYGQFNELSKIIKELKAQIKKAFMDDLFPNSAFKVGAKLIKKGTKKQNGELSLTNAEGGELSLTEKE